MGQYICCCRSGGKRRSRTNGKGSPLKVARLEMEKYIEVKPDRPVGHCRHAGEVVYRDIVILIKNGQDTQCKKLGERWFQISGVTEKLENLSIGHSYATYLAEMQKLPPNCKKEHTILGEAIRVIERDVPRTIPPSWMFEQTRHILETAFQVDKEAVKPYSQMEKSLQRVLTAFVIRNRTIGYCQGLNSIAAILLSVMEERKAFWVLCTICEDFRPRDYYASGSNSMGGLHIDTAIALKLIRRNCVRLAEALNRDFALLVNMSMFHWVLTIFLTEVEFDCACLLFDLFLQFGDAFLLSFLIEIYRSSEEEICKLITFPDFLDRARLVIEGKLTSLTPKILLKTVKQMKYLVTPDQLKKCRCEEREAAAEAWKDISLRKKLTKYTNFTAGELDALQRETGLEEKTGQVGLNKYQFNKFLSTTGAVAQRDFTDALFELFDENSTGFIDFRELVTCLSIFSKGSRDEKIRTLFSYYDKDKSGFLSYDEVVRMAHHLETLIRFLKMDRSGKHLRKDTAEARSDRLYSYLNLANEHGLVSFSEFVAKLRVDQQIVDLFTFDLSSRLTSQDVNVEVLI